MVLFRLPEVRPKGQEALARRRCATLQALPRKAHVCATGAAYGFGRTERLERALDRCVDRLQAMLEGGPMRFKPFQLNWGNRRLDRRNRLTWALQRARIATRLALIAYQQQHNREPDGSSPLLHGHKPRATAIETIPNLKSLWRAKSTEDLEVALDKAQSAILEALQSNDPQTRLNAAAHAQAHAKQENAVGASGSNQTLGSRQAMSQKGEFRPFGHRDAMARMRK